MSFFSSVVLALAVAVSTVAGFTPYSQVYQVQVGANGNLTFDPETIVANVGDTVVYNFHPKNHSVTQSSFQDPCHDLPGGFFSGFVPTDNLTAASPTTFTITINDTKPIWVYCAQTEKSHCQSGMVHAINAPTTGNTIDAFKAAASKASTSTSPANGLPVGGLRKTSVIVSPNDELQYSSNNITALIGEVIEFSFNPANHSVVQSSFGDPCHPLSTGGFSSGFVPTEVAPSGALFDIVVNDTKPIWFYCAQTKKTHCQAGMVGSINAPTSGPNTLEAFIGLAAKASLSTIPPAAPIGGILTVNGTVVATDGGDVLDSSKVVSANSTISVVPPPGTSIPPDVSGMAGGSQPSNYNWGSSISANATSFLTLILFLDNVLLEALVNGNNNLTTGGWSNVYPQSITDTISSMTAQALVHRSTSTDSLSHYNKPMVGLCSYNFPISNVDDFVVVALTLILLEIGLLLDAMANLVLSDPWLISPLASTLGSKARMAGMVNMMQDHVVAAAPREAWIPADLVYSYAYNHYVVPNSCPMNGATGGLPGYTALPSLTLSNPPVSGTGRVTAVTVSYPSSITGTLFIAWLGPWGSVEYTPVVNGNSSVPSDLSGHVWGVLTNASGGSVQDLMNVAVAGPDMVWVTNP
ncbi:hypothetical protein V8E51_016347 [Hyaloscypha variabilis]